MPPKTHTPLATVLTVLAAAVVVASPALAHDSWLRTPRFTVPVGKSLPIALMVGESCHAEQERAFQRARTVSFVRVRAGSTDDLLPSAAEGARPVATLRFDTPGGHLIAMERAPTNLTLDAEAFNAYLTSEGLSGPLATRRARGALGAPGRERYVRAMKTLVQVGAARDLSFASVLGFALEIVPDADPTTLHPGDAVHFRVLAHGRPVGGVTVDACGELNGAVTAERIVSDAEGHASVRLPHAGPWFLRAVHMEPCAACQDADWSSAWTSYAFGI